ncbi:hypothetical protein BTI73_00005, partial [Lactobacillus delbrueckii subsp. bulgaricus]|nr:hypothetical protein [Lactobacillus delbrueckii subsp. bulgaricus]
TAFTGVDSQNLRDVMVSVQFILAIGERIFFLQYNAKNFLSKRIDFVKICYFRLRTSLLL